MKTIVISFLLLCALLSSPAAAETGKLEDVPSEIKVHNPVTISTSHYDIDGDNLKESVEIVLTSGTEIKETELWCGFGDRWEGDFIVRVRKQAKELGRLSLNEHMGKREGRLLSFWKPEFSLILQDYNGDGDIDFNLGQYGSCEGNDFWLFTIRNDGQIEPLPMEDGYWFFIQDPSHVNSTDAIIVENKLIKYSTYNRYSEVRHTSWYKWDGKHLVVAKKKVISYTEPFKDFPIKNRHLLGSWELHSGNEAVCSIVFRADGTFHAQSKPGSFSGCVNRGTWTVRDNHLVWTYNVNTNGLKKGEEDVNIILDFEQDTVLLKEMSGGKTTLERSK